MAPRLKLNLALISLCLLISARAAEAQIGEPACGLYKVTSRKLNISRDADGQTYIDVLEQGDVACVTRQQTVGATERGFVAHKLSKSPERRPVNGWAAMRFLQELPPADAGALQPTVTPPAGAAVLATPAPSPAAGSPAAVATPAAAAAEPEVVLRFDQPIPFGAQSVIGRTIKELSGSVPLFPPIEGLDEAAWKKPCSTCHKWDEAQLCEQGKGYAKTAAPVMRHPHPFGGAYKTVLMQWAKTGCK